MQDSNVPAKFPLIWGVNAGASFIRAIPTTTASPIAASLSLGFPPETATPIASGGTPPDVRDVNGILSQLSAWSQWQQAGGPLYYDASFSASVGGYPKGALLSNATTPGAYWVSTADNNTSDPDTGGANWSGFNLNNLGTAAYKAASSNAQANVASVAGTITTGHLAVFADTSGTIQDGGALGTFGTAASKAASNNSYSVVSSFTGASTIGHIASFVDGSGSIQDSGLSVSNSIGITFLATTSFVNTSYAPIASPTFTGTPAAPTAVGGTNTTQIATTAFVQTAISTLAPLNSPSLTGTPTAPTAAPGTNNTQIASTAFVQAAVGNITHRYARVLVTFSGQSFNVAAFTWNASFPTACLAAVACAETNDTFNPGSSGNNFVAITYNTVGASLTGGNIRVDTEQGGSVSGSVFVSIIGIGN